MIENQFIETAEIDLKLQILDSAKKWQLNRVQEG
jgi:hypothetical protein